MEFEDLILQKKKKARWDFLADLQSQAAAGTYVW